MSMRLMFVEIASDLVTNEEYWEFCEATGRDKGKTVGGRPKQPVVNVSWYDAMDYACWKSEQTGVPWRLPLEEELKEAEGFIPEDADFSAWPLPELPDVGTHPETTSSLGHNDLVGVVYQWTMRPEDKVKYDEAWRDYVARCEAAEAERRSVQPRLRTGERVAQEVRGSVFVESPGDVGAGATFEGLAASHAARVGFRMLRSIIGATEMSDAYGLSYGQSAWGLLQRGGKNRANLKYPEQKVKSDRFRGLRLVRDKE